MEKLKQLKFLNIEDLIKYGILIKRNVRQSLKIMFSMSMRKN